MLKHASAVSALHHWRLGAARHSWTVPRNADRCVKGLEGCQRGRLPWAQQMLERWVRTCLAMNTRRPPWRLREDQTVSAAHAASVGQPSGCVQARPYLVFFHLTGRLLMKALLPILVLLFGGCATTPEGNGVGTRIRCESLIRRVAFTAVIRHRKKKSGIE